MPDYTAIANLLRQLADALDNDTPTTHAPGPAHDPAIISAINARQIALDRGLDLNPATLRMACTRGAIPSAHKRGGRWYLPENAFLVWLNNFTPRTCCSGALARVPAGVSRSLPGGGNTKRPATIVAGLVMGDGC